METKKLWGLGIISTIPSILAILIMHSVIKLDSYGIDVYPKLLVSALHFVSFLLILIVMIRIDKNLVVTCLISTLVAIILSIYVCNYALEGIIIMDVASLILITLPLIFIAISLKTAKTA